MFRHLDFLCYILSANIFTYGTFEGVIDTISFHDIPAYMDYPDDLQEVKSRYGINIEQTPVDYFKAEITAILFSIQPMSISNLPLTNEVLLGPYYQFTTVQEAFNLYIIAKELAKPSFSKADRIDFVIARSSDMGRSVFEAIRSQSISNIPLAGTTITQGIVKILKTIDWKRYNVYPSVLFRGIRVRDPNYIYSSAVTPTNLVTMTYSEYLDALQSGRLYDIASDTNSISVVFPFYTQIHHVDADYSGDYYMSQMAISDSATVNDVTIVQMWADTVKDPRMNQTLINSLVNKEYSQQDNDIIFKPFQTSEIVNYFRSITFKMNLNFVQNLDRIRTNV